MASTSSVMINVGIIGLSVLALIGISTYLALRYYNSIKDKQNLQSNETTMVRADDCNSLEQILYTISDDDYEEIGHFPSNCRIN